MRACFVLLIVALAPLTRTAAQHQPRPASIGAYFGASFSTPTDPRAGRVGATAVVPVIGPIDFYPAFDIFPDVGAWQWLLDLRVQPLGSTGTASMWYIGAGIALSDQAPRKAFVTGFQPPSAAIRPFLEFRFLGDIEELNPELDVVAGVTVRLQ